MSLKKRAARDADLPLSEIEIFPAHNLWDDKCPEYIGSRSTAYREITDGRLKAVKVRGRTFIRRRDYAAYLAALPPTSIGQSKAA